MPRQALLAALSIVALTACEGGANRPPTPPDPAPVTQQTWLCGREYVNMAWGYQRRGLVLDTQGNIWKYDFRGSPTALVNPWGPKDMANMSEEELKLRYNGATVTGTKVPTQETARHMPLIAEAAQATPTQPQSRGADMGQNTLYCYTYDAASRTYAQVMLDNKGDWDSTNPSQAAKTLGVWLNSRLGEVK